ncbi:hypothetical protein CDL12_09876 [Handroanthus impetiginosus]|uniref:Uncharacterized protein n=1 Tax=Handroanthus impetiginosus TaxID=429701 RepID=A0A2G9HIZ2_9LAMI|nr:hypothetical protein CDL12_09876 [Handroanthus impetiginosus]
MEVIAAQNHQFPPKPQCLMTTPLSSKLSPPLLLRLTPAACRLFATTSAATTTVGDPEVVTISEPLKPKPRPNGSRRGTTRDKKVGLDVRQMKLNWLDSLSCPFPDNCRNRVSEVSECGSVDSGWVLGVDPDISGALAVLKPDNSAEVFDSPHVKVLVGKRARKRLDVKSIIKLLQNVDAPIGTTVYIEQSIPYPQDGKQGWWSGGFGYGLWIGILVASGYSVVPIPSLLWKNGFKLAGNRSSKDDSRELASTLFPSMSSLLKRKKDHGRAEALLIAAYGKGLKVNFNTSCILEDLMP